MSGVSVRYIVNDVDAAIDFYKHLGFDVVMHPAPAFAILSRDGFRLMLSAPTGEGGGGRAMPDGARPEPGGWNRIQIQVPNLEEEVDRLRSAGVNFRNEIITGIGAKQILALDPSGNLVEINEMLPR